MEGKLSQMNNKTLPKSRRISLEKFLQIGLRFSLLTLKNGKLKTTQISQNPSSFQKWGLDIHSMATFRLRVIFLLAPFYITLLNYNKTKCNRKSCQIVCVGNKKERAAQQRLKLSNPMGQSEAGHDQTNYIIYYQFYKMRFKGLRGVWVFAKTKKPPKT